MARPGITESQRELVRQLLREGLTQKEVSKRSGVSTVTVWKLAKFVPKPDREKPVKVVLESASRPASTHRCPSCRRLITTVGCLACRIGGNEPQVDGMQLGGMQVLR